MNNFYKQATLRVPMKLVNGQWEYFYGGALPVKDGTVADMIVDESSFTDKAFINTLKQRSRHKILDEDTELLVALTIKPEPKLDKKIKHHLIPIHFPDIQVSTVFHNNHLSPDTMFVTIKIGGPTDQQVATNDGDGGGLWLDIQGLQPKGLVSSSINLPEGVSDEPAISLNHAFTLLSQAYEPWRKSHTGNIYSRMFYKEKNSRWYPLEILRNTSIAKEEHQLIKEQWDRISKSLGLEFHS